MNLHVINMVRSGHTSVCFKSSLKMVLGLQHMCDYLLQMYFKIVHTFIVWLFYCSYHILYMISCYVIMILLFCVRMWLCIEARKLLLYCYIDDFVAVGRAEAINPMASSAASGCGLSHTFSSSAQIHDYHFTCIYPLLFHFGLLYCFTTACTCQKWQIKFNIFLLALNVQIYHIDGMTQDCNNFSALPMELQQSCAKLSTWKILWHWWVFMLCIRNNSPQNNVRCNFLSMF